MIVTFFNIRKYSICLMGCLFVCIATQVICNDGSKRSIVFKKGFKLVKTLPDGSKETWRPMPNQKIQLPDNANLHVNNQGGNQSIIVKKKGAGKTISVEISSGETAQIIESDTGKTGLLQTHADGTQSLHAIGGSVDFEETVSDQAKPITKPLESLNNPSNKEAWTSVANKIDGAVTVFPPCDTVKLPPDDYDQYDAYNGPIKESINTISDDASWFSYTIGCGFAGIAIYGAYYLANQAKICARYLYRDDLWSVWGLEEEPYEVLLQIKPEDLADNLIEAIDVKYYGEENPIELFLKDIEQEYDILLQWIQFRNNVTTFYLPVGPDFYTMENRLRFLELMRKSVYYWRAQQLSRKKSIN